jgi:hypothetical protein
MKTRDGSLCLRPRLVAMSRRLPTDAQVSTPRLLRSHRQESLETCRLDCRQAHHLQGDVVILVGSCCGVLRMISLGLEPEIRARVAENFGAPRQHHDLARLHHLAILTSCRQRPSSG